MCYERLPHVGFRETLLYCAQPVHPADEDRLHIRIALSSTRSANLTVYIPRLPESGVSVGERIWTFR